MSVGELPYSVGAPELPFLPREAQRAPEVVPLYRYGNVGRGNPRFRLVLCRLSIFLGSVGAIRWFAVGDMCSFGLGRCHGAHFSRLPGAQRLVQPQCMQTVRRFNALLLPAYPSLLLTSRRHCMSTSPSVFSLGLLTCYSLRVIKPIPPGPYRSPVSTLAIVFRGPPASGPPVQHVGPLPPPIPPLASQLSASRMGH